MKMNLKPLAFSALAGYLLASSLIFILSRTSEGVVLTRRWWFMTIVVTISLALFALIVTIENRRERK